MIFNAHEVKFILAGRTTHTTRPSLRNGQPPCKRGHTYILQKRVPRVEDDDGQVIKPTQIETTPHRLLVTSVKRDQDRWAITFEIDRRETIVLLHKHSERGYTTRASDAMPGEPEPVASTKDLERYVREADAHLAERRRRQKERTLNAKLKRARAAGVNTEPIIDKALVELDDQAA